MRSRDDRFIRLVAIFKLLKAASLIVTGIGILKLMHVDVALQLDRWVSRLGLDPGSHLVSRFIEKATRLPPARIKELGIVSFAYAGLFLTEGIGLWLMKRWAEWFTVITTSSLLPFEIYELWRHPTVMKAVVLAINIAVVIYLIVRIRSESRRRNASA
jgi:uncharacterized membrane protein (DUF2068 family)